MATDVAERERRMRSFAWLRTEGVRLLVVAVMAALLVAGGMWLNDRLRGDDDWIVIGRTITTDGVSIEYTAPGHRTGTWQLSGGGGSILSDCWPQVRLNQRLPSCLH